ncbi:rhodanese-like domain-containing protein [Candidatus Marinimicrobia bacterium]|nr:rhodanese-like domain-containing protein [Candidatus Neomarinimicrobiota bacterium]
MKIKTQIIFLITIPVFIGIIINIIKPKSLPWVAEPILLIKNQNDLSAILSEPEIREIGLSVAFNLHNDGTLFVDAREEEYIKEGFITGAIYDDDIEVLAAKIDTLVGLDRPFVIYCSDDDCGSSEDLAYNLQDWGFMNILVFKGGWKMWTESGYQVQENE